MVLKSGLYVVATPIGNLGDITLRALDVLKGSDIILCEDTRVSNKLLAKHSIKAILRVYNDNSDASSRQTVKDWITAGKVVSLVSDAGTPLISDPGYKLVRDLKNDGFYVDVIPGPCAAIAALTLSGLPTDSFFFAGFLPKTKEGKTNIFKAVSSLPCTIIFYETSIRLLQSLTIAKEVLGNRQANVARELTKLYQESNSASLLELIKYYTQNPPKGEIVLSISGIEQLQVSSINLQTEIADLIATGLSAKSISDQIFSKYKSQFKRKEIYKMVNQFKKGI
ncbi:MAG: 16S rRNA (cytidine(1402)-2'-O)-methyltransferase [Rickettsiaceae bacterium]